MKKTLLVLMMAMAATVGCVEMNTVVPVSDMPLVVDACQGWESQETKAPVTGTTFPTDLTMCLTSYSSATGATFFNDIPFSYNSGAGGWKATTGKYWPQTGTLDFIAYSCPGLTPTVTYNSTNASSGITSFVTGDNRTAQADLMFGAASGCTYSPSSKPTLNFKHAMSLVTFTGCCPDISFNGSEGVTIESITLATAYYGGTCSATRSGSTINSISWSATSNSYNGASVPGISSVGLPTTATPVGNGILLPPQSAVNFTINYKVWSGGVGTSKSYTYTNSGTWQMAKRHVYAIEITIGNEIVVNASVQDWDAGGQRNWMYLENGRVTHLGDSFSLASGQPVYWRLNSSSAYEQLTYYSGTYGTKVAYSSSSGYFIHVTAGANNTYSILQASPIYEYSNERTMTIYFKYLQDNTSYSPARRGYSVRGTVSGSRRRSVDNGETWEAWESYTVYNVIDNGTYPFTYVTASPSPSVTYSVGAAGGEKTWWIAPSSATWTLHGEYTDPEGNTYDVTTTKYLSFSS